MSRLLEQYRNDVCLLSGGGHNPSGASSSDGGLVIDLSKYLNRVTVDQEAKIANVQGGALWSDVDAASCPLGLATVGGTVSEVSVILFCWNVALSSHIDWSRRVRIRPFS